MQSPGKGQNIKLCIGCNRYSPKSMINVNLAICGDLKLDRKLQEATEVIVFLLCSQLADQKINQSA